MTNEDLIQEWKKGEARQKALWQEILRRGLYFQASGIFCKEDKAWRRPVTATLESERNFYKGVHGHRGPAGEKKSRLSEKDVAEFE